MRKGLLKGWHLEPDGMITLVGVGHVFAISENVKGIIRSKLPQVVCLELDPGRYRALTQKDRTRKVPLQYRALAYFQSRMADKFGSEVGDEMLAAAEAAQQVGAKVALIDMDAGRVFGLLWKRMSLREKLHLLGGAFVGLLVSRETVEREVDKYEGNEEMYLKALGKEFPTIKSVLIDDRDKFMAERLTSLSSQYGSIVAIVGDGHIPGMLGYLKQLEVEAVRLKELRVEPPKQQAAQEFSYSFWYQNQ